MTVADTIDWSALHVRLKAAQDALHDGRADDGFENAVLQERTRRLALPEVRRRQVATTDRVMTALVGAERYGFWLPGIAGVAPLGRYASMPHGPDGLLGLSTMRGGIWTIFDATALLGVAAGPGATGHVVLLRHPTRRIGLRIDRADDVRALDPAAVRPLPGAQASPLVAGIAPDGVIIIDIEAVWAHPAITGTA